MIDREQELLHRYLDGQLSEDERQEFESKLTGNEALQKELNDFAEVGLLLREHVDEHVENVAFDSFFSDLEVKLDLEDAKNSISLMDRIRGLFRSPAGAASLVVAAVGLFFVIRNGVGTSPDVPRSQKNAPQVTVENKTAEGNQLIKVSKPVDKADPKVIWLLEKEKDQKASKDAGVKTDAGMDKPF